MSVPVEYPYEEEIPFPRWIRNHSDMTWGEKAYLAEILSIDRISQGKCYYSLKSLSARFKVTPVTVLNWTKKLTNLGPVQVVCDLDGSRDKTKILKPLAGK